MAEAAPGSSQSVDSNRLIRGDYDYFSGVEDPKVLLNMMEAEIKFQVPENFLQLNPHVTEQVRHICLSWIQEICEEQKCEQDIFPLCANYFDRFLAKCEVSQGNLQACVSACYLIASKLRETNPVTVTDMYFYCDCLYTLPIHQTWEVLVLNMLNWDMAAVVATDYLDIILYRLPDFDRIRELVQKHAAILINITLLKLEVAPMKASMLALGAIVVAIRSFPRIEEEWPKVNELIPILSEITNINPVILQQAEEIVRRNIDTEIERLETAKLRQAEVDAAVANPQAAKSAW